MPKRKTVLIAVIIGMVVAAGIYLLFAGELNPKNASPDNPFSNSNIRASIYKTDNGWSYDIYSDDQLLIHQPDIPALAGSRGFATEVDANKVAELMIGKMRNNIFPPAVTVEELKGVGVVE